MSDSPHRLVRFHELADLNRRFEELEHELRLLILERTDDEGLDAVIEEKIQPLRDAAAVLADAVRAQKRAPERNPCHFPNCTAKSAPARDLSELIELAEGARRWYRLCDDHWRGVQEMFEWLAKARESG